MQNHFVRLAVLAAVAVVFLAPAARASTQASSTREQVWELGGRLSLAALGVANGAPEATVQKVYGVAKEIGASLGVDVPALPQRPGNPRMANSTVLNYLLKDAGMPMAQQIGSKYGADHSALFEIAVKTNALLVLYVPGDREVQQVVEVVRKRSPDAKLPEEYWGPLVQKIEARASFDEIKDSVRMMHAAVRQYLRGS